MRCIPEIAFPCRIDTVASDFLVSLTVAGAAPDLHTLGGRTGFPFHPDEKSSAGHLKQRSSRLFRNSVFLNSLLAMQDCIAIFNDTSLKMQETENRGFRFRIKKGP